MISTLFSVSYAGLWGQCRLDLKAFLKKAGSLGYSAVELMGKRPHLSVLDTDQRAVDELREAASEAGVELATVAAYNDFTLACDPSIPAVEIQTVYIRQLTELARRLGAKMIRVFTGYLTQRDSFQRDWDVCIRAAREAAAIAADQGVILGVQNHHDVGVGAASYLQFLEEVDHSNCRAMFDPWAVAIHGDDMKDWARRLAPWMVQTTLADYVRVPRYAYRPGLVNYQRLEDIVRAVPLGEGFVDLEAFFAGLREGGFAGYVAYEMCSPLRGGGSEANLDRVAAKSLEVIRRLAVCGVRACLQSSNIGR